MAKLSKADFFVGGTPKTAATGKYAGLTREQVVLEKIKDKRYFTIAKGDQKIYGVSLDTSVWPYQLSYVTTISNLQKHSGITNIGKKDKSETSLFVEGNITSTSTEEPARGVPGQVSVGSVMSVIALLKDADFGGGKGSGGGAKETSFTESGQCYYTSLAFNVTKRKLEQTDCTTSNLKKAAECVDATISLKDFLENGPQDWQDKNIYIDTANLIYSKFKGKFKGKVYCHRGSKFMNNIYVAKAKVMKSDKFSAPGSFSNDKWNPGDIWLSSLNPASQPLKESITWSELNQKVLDFAGVLKAQPTTSLLGVSLKKLSGKGKIDYYNAAERKHNAKVNFKGFKFGKTGDFFSSMDIYLQFDVAEVQLRAFNTTSAWQGEIKGLAAAGGKIGGGNLNYYLEKHAKKSINYPGNNRVKGAAWKEMSKQQVDMPTMYKLYTELNGKQTGKAFPVASYPEFVIKAKKKGNGFIFSKNMCLMFMNSFFEALPKAKNAISTDIVRYAASNTDISSFYIKVY